MGLKLCHTLFFNECLSSERLKAWNIVLNPKPVLKLLNSVISYLSIVFTSRRDTDCSLTFSKKPLMPLKNGIIKSQNKLHTDHSFY